MLASPTSHIHQLLLRQCQWQRSEVFVYLESYQKAFGFDSKVLLSLYLSPTWALASVSCYSLFPCRVFFFFNSLFCVQSLYCSLCFVWLYKLSTATTQGCIHQSTQGTTANWFLNRISLLPAIRLHHDFLKSLIKKCGLECMLARQKMCLWNVRQQRHAPVCNGPHLHMARYLGVAINHFAVVVFDAVITDGSPPVCIWCSLSRWPTQGGVWANCCWFIQNSQHAFLMNKEWSQPERQNHSLYNFRGSFIKYSDL